MGAKRQGQKTVRQATKAIDALTLTLGSVQSEPVTNLRALRRPLDRLAHCIALFEREQGPEAAEVAPLRSVRAQLRPAIEMVLEADVVDPPFSPDLRQRVSYATSQLTSMRQRLNNGRPRIRTKALLRESDGHLVHMTDTWKAFRTDPSLTNLAEFEQASAMMCHFYYAAGTSPNELRVKRSRKLCALLEQATDRRGELDDVPALLREVTTLANELSRPTLSEHRAWLRSLD